MSEQEDRTPDMDVSALLKAIEIERDKIIKVYSPHAPYNWCIEAIKAFAAMGDGNVAKRSREIPRAMSEASDTSPASPEAVANYCLGALAVATGIDTRSEISVVGQPPVTSQMLADAKEVNRSSLICKMAVVISNSGVVMDGKWRTTPGMAAESAYDLLAAKGYLRSPEPVMGEVSLEKCSNATGLPYGDIIRVFTAAGVKYVE